ncbi:MAG: hypothetical protein M1305_04910, partial [Candidatus Marsarchaeota archaeon]|nr:hypothetical protein [Candidatus Marsarchaeota archaeon]
TRRTRSWVSSMGEGSSAAWVNLSKKSSRGSDKLRRTKLAILPPQAERELWRVAEARGQRALLLLLTKYFLRPEQIATAAVESCTLVALGFERGIRIDATDAEVIRSWLQRKRRPRSAQAIRNALGNLAKVVVLNLEKNEPETDWRQLLDIGVTSLRRLARERFAEACSFEEASYCELVHDEEADPFDNLRWLSRPARQILQQGAHDVVEQIKMEQMTWRSL